MIFSNPRTQLSRLSVKRTITSATHAHPNNKSNCLKAHTTNSNDSSFLARVSLKILLDTSSLDSSSIPPLEHRKKSFEPDSRKSYFLKHSLIGFSSSSRTDPFVHLPSVRKTFFPPRFGLLKIKKKQANEKKQKP